MQTLEGGGAARTHRHGDLHGLARFDHPVAVAAGALAGGDAHQAQQRIRRREAGGILGRQQGPIGIETTAGDRPAVESRKRIRARQDGLFELCGRQGRPVGFQQGGDAGDLRRSHRGPAEILVTAAESRNLGSACRCR